MHLNLKITLPVLSLIVILFSGCTPDEAQIVEENVEIEDEKSVETKYALSDSQIFGDISETAAIEPGVVEIKDLGSFYFDPAEVISIRSDIFQQGQFSIFDVLVHLSNNGEIELEYYFDDEMNSYVIEKLDNRAGWWYYAHYDGGWRERSVFRMDHYPYKDNMFLRFFQMNPSADLLESIYDSYREEVNRKDENKGKIIVPNVIISGESDSYLFRDVEITAHNLRHDMFKPGVVTAIDVILSLGDKGLISYDLQWYESIGTADVVKSYWVNRINDDENQGRCGFVYEAGSEAFPDSSGNHIHIPSDVRVLNSPEYIYFFWICI